MWDMYTVVRDAAINEFLSCIWTIYKVMLKANWYKDNMGHDYTITLYLLSIKYSLFIVKNSSVF